MTVSAWHDGYDHASSMTSYPSDSGKEADTGDKTAGPAGQLYNLRTDPAEKENLYDKHPDIVAELGALLKQYKTSGRSRPSRRPS